MSQTSQFSSSEQKEMEELKREIGSIMSTAEIMKKARDESLLTERECEVALDAWKQTGKDGQQAEERGSRFKKLLGKNFGPGRSTEIFDMLNTRTKEAKEIAGKISNDFKLRIQRNRMAARAAASSANSDTNAPNSIAQPPTGSQAAPRDANVSTMPTNYHPPNYTSTLPIQPQSIPTSAMQPGAGSNPYPHQAMYTQPGMANQPPLQYQPNYPPSSKIPSYQGTNLPTPAYIPRSLPSTSTSVANLHANAMPRVGGPQTATSPFDVKGLSKNPGMTMTGVPMASNPNLNPNLIRMNPAGSSIPSSGSMASITSMSSAGSNDNDGDKNKSKKRASTGSDQPDLKKIKKEILPSSLPIPPSLPIQQQHQRPIQYIPRPTLPGSGQMTYQVSEDLIPPDLISIAEQEDANKAIQRSEAEKEAELARRLIRDSLITKEASTTSSSTRSSRSFTTAQTHHHDESNVMTYDDVGQQVVNVLASSGVTIEERAVHMIIDAIQLQTRRLLEVAVSNNKKRLNKFGIGNYSELSKLRELITSHTSSTEGSMIEEEQDDQHDQLLMNRVGMKWGPDVKRALSLEESKKLEHMRRVQISFEESLVLEIRDYTNKQPPQMAGNKRSESLSHPKWLHDEVSEKQGDLSWNELVVSHVRTDAAKRNGITVPAIKRPYISSSDEQTAAINSSKAKLEFPKFAGCASEEEMLKGSNRCPLLVDSMEFLNELKSDDIAAAIAKLATSKTGGPYNEALGTCLRKYHAGISL